MKDKNFSPNMFIGDMGQMPDLIRECYAKGDKGECVEKIVEGFEKLRFFVPIIVNNDMQEETGFVLDDFAGEKVILAFSNVDDFNICFPEARPMAFLGKDLISLSMRLKVGRILIDKGNMDLLIGRQAVFCISEGKEWVPVWKNHILIDKLGVLLSKIEKAKGYQVRVGNKCEVEILVAFDCDKSEVVGLVSGVKNIISDFPEFLQYADSIEIIPFKA